MAAVFPSIRVDDLLFGAGLNIRTPVRAATTVAGTLATSFEAGDTIDGITLSANDRILIKNQASGIENGVYVVQASGTPVRAEDLVTGFGASLYYVYVREGTLNSNSAWLCTNTTGSDVVGTDALTWIRSGGFGTPHIPSTVTPVDNAIVRFDGTTGEIQESTIILDDNGNLTGVGDITFDETTNDLTLAVNDQATGTATATIPDLGGVSDTFVFTTLMQTLNNKTLVSPLINTSLIFDEATNDLTVVATDQATGPATVTIPDLAGVSGDMLITNAVQTITNKSWGDNLNMNNFKITNLATPTGALDAANKEYVDSVSAGLDPKESVRFTTLLDISGTYNSTGGTGGTGEFTAVDLTATSIFDLDGNTVGIGDRLLIKNQADPKENGIYVVTTAGAAGVIERAPDQDGSPANEVSGGNFTFVENGATYENTGWVLQGDGILTLNTDDLNWVQYTGAGLITAGDGLSKIGNTLNVNVTDVSLGIASDNVVVRSTATAGQVLRSTGVDGQEATWGAVNLANTNAVTGTLAVGNGGTGAITFTSGELLQGNGTSAISSTGIVTSTVLTTTNTQTVTNKSFEDASTTFYDDVTPSKTFQFQASGITAATNRTYTMPDFNTTLVGTDATQTLSNKTLTEPRFVDLGFIADSSGNEMLVFDSVASAVNNIQIANAATGTNPLLTVVGGDTNIGLDFGVKGTGVYQFTATASNGATMRFYENTGNGINYTALKAAESITTDTTFTLPSADGMADYILKTNGAGILSFVDPASLTPPRISYAWINTQFSATSTSFVSISYFAWDDSSYTGYGTVLTVIFWYGTSANRDLIVDVYNGTSTIGTTTVPSGSANGIFTFTITKPSSDVRLEFRIRKSAGGGANPSIFAAQLEITTS